jgi:hypothetical protein
MMMTIEIRKKIKGKRNITKTKMMKLNQYQLKINLSEKNLKAERKQQHPIMKMMKLNQYQLKTNLSEKNLKVERKQQHQIMKMIMKQLKFHHHQSLKMKLNKVRIFCSNIFLNVFSI